jgi:FkbM family methyltransferase
LGDVYGVITMRLPARRFLFNPSVRKLIRPVVRLLRCQSVNRLVRPFIRPLSFLAGDAINAVPVVGLLEFRLNDGRTFRMDSDGEDTIVNGLYWNGLYSYENETIYYFQKIVSASRIIFDIGANTGIYSFIAAVGNAMARVYAFEPNPNVFEYLTRNLAANSLENTKLEPTAITDYDGTIDLHITSEAVSTSSSTIPSSKFNKFIEVPAMKLDTYCRMKNITEVSLLKIDTECTEHLVIKGGLDVIIRDQPIMICEVLQGHTERFLQELLDPIGYEYYWLSDKGPIQQQVILGHTERSMNYLFVTERRKSVLCDLGIL